MPRSPKPFQTRPPEVHEKRANGGSPNDLEAAHPRSMRATVGALVSFFGGKSVLFFVFGEEGCCGLQVFFFLCPSFVM